MNWIAKHFQLDAALLVLALALGVILNWRSFFVDCLAIDEHVSFWIADRSGPSNLLDRSFNYSATPPLFFLLQSASLTAFGDREWALRLPAAASFLGAIVAVWWVGRSQFRPLCGGLAALLMATQPAAQDYAVVGRPYSLGMLLGVLAMLATSRLGEQPSSRRRWIAWILVNLALVQTHYLFAVLWVAELLWLAWPAAGRPFSFRRVVGAGAILLALAVSVSPGLLRVWDHRLYLNWTTGSTSIGDLWALALPVHHDWLEYPPWWGLLATPVLWLLVAHRPSPKNWFEPAWWKSAGLLFGRMVIWFVFPVGGLWLLGRYWFHSLAAARYLVIYVPASVLILAALLSSLRGTVAPILACIAIGIGWQVRPMRGRPIQNLSVQLHHAQTLPNAVDTAWKGSSRYVDLSEIAGRTTPLTPSATPVQVRLVLVSSGLTEMSLVPGYLNDAVFHDYVSCRLGRMYLVGGYKRLSLPLFWTDEARRFFRQAILRAAEQSKSPITNRTPTPPEIVLVVATDTDLLRASAEQAEALILATGAKESARINRPGMTYIIYHLDDKVP